MTVAIIDGDPPPHTRTQTTPFTTRSTGAEDETDLFDDPFSLDIQPPGTYGYGATAVAKSGGSNKSNHDTSHPQRYQPPTSIYVLPPPRHDLKKMIADIRRMCDKYAPMEAPLPPRRNEDAATIATKPTTTITTTIADSRLAIVLSCSDYPTCCTMTNRTTPALKWHTLHQ